MWSRTEKSMDREIIGSFVVFAAMASATLPLLIPIIPQWNRSDELPWLFGLLTFLLILVGGVVCCKRGLKSDWFWLNAPWLGLVFKLVLVLCLTRVVYVIAVEEASPVAAAYTSSGLTPALILFSAVLATVGWNYTAYENRQTEIRRFTIQTIEKLNEDPIHQRLKTEFWLAQKHFAKSTQEGLFEISRTLHRHDGYRRCVNYFISGAPLHDNATAAPDDASYLEAARRAYAVGAYLDQLEWLALQVRQRRIDETALKEMHADTLKAACCSFDDFIAEARAEDAEYYEHLVWLNARWGGDPIPDPPQKTAEAGPVRQDTAVGDAA